MTLIMLEITSPKPFKKVVASPWKSSYALEKTWRAPKRPEEATLSPGIGITDSCDPPCGCQELDPGPLEEQPVLLTAEPFLHYKNININIKKERINFAVGLWLFIEIILNFSSIKYSNELNFRLVFVGGPGPFTFSWLKFDYKAWSLPSVIMDNFWIGEKIPDAIIPKG
ncbi:hypothetical protein STEG23_015995 [Scotinomys teguina]